MMTPSAQLLIAAATAFAGIDHLHNEGEHAAGGQDGPTAADFLRAAGCATDGAWSTAFIHHVGYLSHFDHSDGISSWPLPPMADANALARFAADQAIRRSDPAPYDLYTLWSPVRQAFTRTGIILSVGAFGWLPNDTWYWECITIEGDSSPRLGAGGTSVKRARRFLSSEAGDCFIRWLDRGAIAAAGVGRVVAADEARVELRRAA